MLTFERPYIEARDLQNAGWEGYYESLLKLVFQGNNGLPWRKCWGHFLKKSHQSP